ncbi:MAG TPA: hypothetical protein VNS55_12685 [Nocardioides sp.]|nr:hypothetical protein [Nocardioides sp.]
MKSCPSLPVRVRPLLGMLVSALLATTATTGSATAAPVGVATDYCKVAAVEPARIDLDCSAGDNMLQRSHWTRWGKKAARGRASWCNYCHTGGERQQAHVRLTRPVRGSHGLDGRVFSRLRVTWRADGTRHTQVWKLTWSGGATVENGWFWVQV